MRLNSIIIRIILIIFTIFNCFGCEEEALVKDIASGILQMRNPATGIPASFLGHPGYEKLIFSYDAAVACLVLKATGKQKEAERIMDYIVKRFNIPQKKLERIVDDNGIFGIIKLLKPILPGKKVVKAVINGFRIDDTSKGGKGYLEFVCTPGPTSFFIMALLQLNKDKYLATAKVMGETLLAMQGKDGGIRDGDRLKKRIHVEPHVDSVSAFLSLYEVTRNQKWYNAAMKGIKWFKKYPYDKKNGIIHQGIQGHKKYKIFATDVYSWTMAGAMNKYLSLEELKKLTHNLLKKSLVRITVTLPDDKTKEIILVDFTDPYDKTAIKIRKGIHPLGSPEWLGGVILALQKNAVRFWQEGDRKTGSFYKAIAQILLMEAKKVFYYIPELYGGATSFYATGQGINVGHGWKTAYYFVKNSSGEVLTRGGSIVSSWPILPLMGLNPFIYNDQYKGIYDEIPILDQLNAKAYLEKILKGRSYTEKIPLKLPNKKVQIVEPGEFNKHMWLSYEKGIDALAKKKTNLAKTYLNDSIRWARLVLSDRNWVRQAYIQNRRKKKKYGGIIWYPWGYKKLDNNLLLHRDILHYPLLNEVGASMWGLANAYNILGQKQRAKYWIRRIIREIPLHQIPVMDNHNKGQIIGYWNALSSWGRAAGSDKYEDDIKKLYLQVVKEFGRSSISLKTVYLQYDAQTECFN